jgi:HK97 family phage prohead protease
MQRFYGGSLEPLGPRQLGVVASTDQLGRDGHVIEPSGIDLTAYRRNPIVLWQHMPDSPIGIATAIGVREGALMARLEFAPEGISPIADQICSLTKEGILAGVSIGFDPLEMSPIDPARPRGGQRFTKVELLEISVVAIPADTGAGVVERSALPRRAALYRSLQAVPASAVERVASRLPSRREAPFSPSGHVWMLLESHRLDRLDEEQRQAGSLPRRRRHAARGY